MAVRAVTIGFFDGVHIGHRRVLNTLLDKGGSAGVVTFWPHPRTVLQQEARGLYLLSSLQEKMQAIHDCGVQQVECLEFTRDFASMTAEAFVKEYLIGRMGCTHLVLGYDNRIGSDGLSTQQLAALARSMGLEVQIVDPCVLDGITVSSTQVRNALGQGDVTLAAKMLGRPYSISGMVVPGNRIGRTIGFPTANIALSFPLKAVPANGVYATRVVVQGKMYQGMTNIGVRPTVASTGEKVIETNIFDFDRDIYGLEIEIIFDRRIRGEVRFSSLEELAGQLEKDKILCRLN